jgi:release factor glutamine methyltransferase
VRVQESWVGAANRLADHGVEVPSLEAEVLVRHVLGIDRAQFFAVLSDGLPCPDEGEIDRLVARRLAGEPLAYIQGHREFYGLELVVNPSVLVPRQETETLVEQVLELSKHMPAEGLRVADVGSGSGAIAIAIAVNLPQATLYATDASREALEVARVNCDNHGVSERVHLYPGDLVDALPCDVDIIVSNPPYIESGELEHLAEEVRREPAIALDGGVDGLRVIRRLFQQAPPLLRPGGKLVVEIAPEQLESVSALARNTVPAGQVSFRRDLLGLPRAVVLSLS